MRFVGPAVSTLGRLRSVAVPVLALLIMGSRVEQEARAGEFGLASGAFRLSEGVAWNLDPAGGPCSVWFATWNDEPVGHLDLSPASPSWDLRVPAGGATLPGGAYHVLLTRGRDVVGRYRMNVDYKLPDGSIPITDEAKDHAWETAFNYSSWIPPAAAATGCCILGPVIGMIRGERLFVSGDVLFPDPGAPCWHQGAIVGGAIGAGVGIPLAWTKIRPGYERKYSRPVRPDQWPEEVRSQLLATVRLQPDGLPQKRRRHRTSPLAPWPWGAETVAESKRPEYLLDLKTPTFPIEAGTHWLTGSCGGEKRSLRFSTRDDVEIGTIEVDGSEQAWDLRVPPGGPVLSEGDYRVSYDCGGARTERYLLRLSYALPGEERPATPEIRSRGSRWAVVWSVLFALGGAVTLSANYADGVNFRRIVSGRSGPTEQTFLGYAAAGFAIGAGAGIPVSFGPLRRHYVQHVAGPIQPEKLAPDLRAGLVATADLLPADR